jgi:hypothetical protein
MVPESSLITAIHRSLKSPAADVLMYMGDATVNNILKKLESFYGTVMSGDTLLTKFYSEPQLPAEDCAQWAARLENVGYGAVEKDAIESHAIARMLSSRFWAGLRNLDIKNALRGSKTQTIEQLVLQARQLEEEYEGKAHKKAGMHQQQEQQQQQQQQQHTDQSEMKKLLKKMDEMMNTFKQNQKPYVKTHERNTTDPKKPVTCHSCKEEGHMSYSCRQGTDMTCYRYKKVGHVAKGCRNPLNE